MGKDEGLSRMARQGKNVLLSARCTASLLRLCMVRSIWNAILQVARPPKGEKPPSNKLYIFFYGTHEQ